jgi:hypothetical protein
MQRMHVAQTNDDLSDYYRITNKQIIDGWFKDGNVR